MRGITKRFPGRAGERRGRLRGRRRRGARAARRERRRQEHALEHPHRPLPAGRGRDQRCTASRSTSTRRATRSTPGSAWCTSTSASCRRSPSPRTSSSASTGRRRAASSSTRAGSSGDVAELGERYGLAVDPRRARLAALRRRAAAGRDPEGALPRGADPDPRRADRGAHAAGGRVALRDAAPRWRRRAGR